MEIKTSNRLIGVLFLKYIETYGFNPNSYRIIIFEIYQKFLAKRENNSLKIINLVYNIKCVVIYYLFLLGIYNNPTLYICNIFWRKTKDFSLEF